MNRKKTLSVVAQSATLLGTCIVGASAIAKYGASDDTHFRPWEGIGGGGGSEFEIGGTQSITLSATAPSGQRIQYTLSFTVGCPGSTDYVNCYGTLLNASKSFRVISELSAQGSCAANQFAGSIGGRYTKGSGFNRDCTPGNIIHVNWQCVNADTSTIMEWDTGITGKTLSFTGC